MPDTRLNAMMADKALIERYLRGELNENEHRAFLERSEHDNGFRQEVAMQEEMFHALGDTGEKRLRTQVQELIQRERNARRSKRKIAYALAAALAVLITGALVFQLSSGNNDDLFHEHYTHYDAPVHFRGKEADQVLRQELLAAYESGQHEEALSTFSQMQKIKSVTAGDRFFASLSLLEMERPQDALSMFEQLQHTDLAMIHDPVIWYSTLCYVKLNDVASACKALGDLPPTSNYHARANMLMKDLGCR